MTLIVLHGVESTGKTMLGRRLAGAFGAQFLPEFGRAFCEIHGTDCDVEDLLAIGHSQQANIEVALLERPTVISDTDSLMTAAWAQMMLGEVPPALLKARKASLADAAKTFALLNIAMSDAFVASWATKYSLNLLRPVTYVQLVIDSAWVPTLMDNPPFPEYPSGHSVQSSAAAGVLAQVFGAQTGFTDNTHNDRGWGPRSFKDFQSAADEAARSRLYAGIHFGFGVNGGQAQGRCVAAKVLALKYRR